MGDMEPRPSRVRDRNQTTSPSSDHGRRPMLPLPHRARSSTRDPHPMKRKRTDYDGGESQPQRANNISSRKQPVADQPPYRGSQKFQVPLHHPNHEPNSSPGRSVPKAQGFSHLHSIQEDDRFSRYHPPLPSHNPRMHPVHSKRLVAAPGGRQNGPAQLSHPDRVASSSRTYSSRPNDMSGSRHVHAYPPHRSTTRHVHPYGQPHKMIDGEYENVEDGGNYESAGYVSDKGYDYHNGDYLWD